MRVFNFYRTYKKIFEKDSLEITRINTKFNKVTSEYNIICYYSMKINSKVNYFRFTSLIKFLGCKNEELTKKSIKYFCEIIATFFREYNNMYDEIEKEKIEKLRKIRFSETASIASIKKKPSFVVYTLFIKYLFF